MGGFFCGSTVDVYIVLKNSEKKNMYVMYKCITYYIFIMYASALVVWLVIS